jgi:micrococcal nuclease
MQNKFLIAILSILLGGGVVGGYKVIKDNKADVFENSLHPVVRVIDGDTIDIEDDIRVRLLGIDSPERGECFYKESKSFLKDLIGGKQVNIKKDITGVDKYGRFLRYVILPSNEPEEDDILVNEKIIKEGYAFTLAIAPDNEYRDLFFSAQELAKKKKRGLWGSCDYSDKQKTKESLREKNIEPINPECTIKGNISEKGYGKLYFLEGCPNYNRIKIDTRKGEQYFCTESEAKKAGFNLSDSCENTF